ncbi:hypothetical protein DFP73DRAFT_500143 [Morchella snyderi]|nr:hypothetical protein DFP73DRAFT_500143 [Morchella snyderi]
MAALNTTNSRFLPSENQLGVVAVGFSGGQPKHGVEAAPLALINSGLLDSLRNDLEFVVHYDDQVHDFAEHFPASDPPLTISNARVPMLNSLTVSNVTRAISAQVYEHASKGRLVLTLGGDHSIAVGSIAGTAKAIRERHGGREMAVIWVDAHTDINTPVTSGSGNIHGMPVAFISGLAKPPRENLDVFGWIKKHHMINISRLVYIGLRDVDPGEKVILHENGIRAFSMHDVDKYGIGKVMDVALDYLNCGPGQEGMPIHLSFDVDALDPVFAPSTGTPVRGGLTLREGDFICESIHETGCLVAMDLVEVNPLLGENDLARKETIRSGCSLVRCALGESLL